mgnify:CR=1 FL=1
MKYTHNINQVIIIALLIFSFPLNGQSKDQIKNQLKNMGISTNEAKEMAKNRGYNDKQIQEKVNTIGIAQDENQVDFKSLDDEGEFVSSELTNEKVIIDSVINIKSNILTYFGYQIFKGDPSAFQASTYGAVDPNYNIGPGDKIIVMLWGESQFRQEFTVDRGGYVFLPEVGQVFVNGLDLQALEKKFFQILSKVYSTLNPLSGKPTTFMDVSLGDIRPLRIIVLGEVSQPGAYSVSPSTSLSSSLYYFNGPKTSGSLRDIQLLRNDKLIGNIDFYDYLLYGKIPQDIRLQMDDIVFIPNRSKTVAIKGEIKREGIYELKDDETLEDWRAGNWHPHSWDTLDAARDRAGAGASQRRGIRQCRSVGQAGIVVDRTSCP